MTSDGSLCLISDHTQFKFLRTIVVTRGMIEDTKMATISRLNKKAFIVLFVKPVYTRLVNLGDCTSELLFSFLL